jgi:predicted phosphoribosyltransferase
VPGDPQTGLPLAARVTTPAFVAMTTVPPRVVLVDDVVTTGSTLSAAARALRVAGATEVLGLVVARTPIGVEFLVEGALKNRRGRAEVPE